MIGIYKISNKETAKCYVGLSILVDERINNHKAALRAGCHKNIELQEDWIKCGEDGFYFDVIDIIDVDDYSRANLHKIETEYIHHFNKNTYNIAKVPPKPSSIKKHRPAITPSQLEKKLDKLKERKDELYLNEDYSGTLNLKEAERSLIIKAAQRCGFNRQKMAKEIGYSERTMYRKIQHHGLAGVI